MKKLLSMEIALILVFSCASALAELTFTTGGTAGTYYAFGGVLAQYISDHSDVQVTAVAGEGSAANIDMLDMGYAQLGFVQSDVAYYAANGIRFEQYEGNPVTSFTALAALYNETVQLVTCDPEIKSMDDLRGKNVSIGAAGSGVYFNAVDILGAYGIDVEKDISAVYQNFADSADSLKNGKVDAAFIVAGAPTTAITDLSTSKQAYLVSMDAKHIAKLQETSPYYAAATIPAGTYSGMDADTTTVSVLSVVLANNSVSEDDVYNFTKSLFDGAQNNADAHAKYKELDLETATSITSVPYHAGAAKYYKEQNVEVPTA